MEWGIEMAGTAQLERQGISPATFGAGTVFSVHLNPLRDGSNFGARVGALAKCPADPATNKPKLPEPGKHCDSVAGNDAHRRHQLSNPPDSGAEFRMRVILSSASIADAEPITFGASHVIPAKVLMPRSLRTCRSRVRPAARAAVAFAQTGEGQFQVGVHVATRDLE